MYTVKLFILSPFDVIRSSMMGLIESEYEVYPVAAKDREKLLNFLGNEVSCIILICIHRREDVISWIQYMESLRAIEGSLIRIGVVVRDEILYQEKNLFLYDNIPVISEMIIKKAPMKAFSLIFKSFEGDAKRRFVRARAYRNDKIFFSFKVGRKMFPVTCDLVDISSEAFSCRVSPSEQIFFLPNDYCDNVTLQLHSVRLSMAVKFLNYGQNDPDKIVCKMLDCLLHDKKTSYTPLGAENKKKIHKYIFNSLQDEFNKLLSSGTENTVD